jgi:hypothetical protein
MPTAIGIFGPDRPVTTPPGHEPNAMTPVCGNSATPVISGEKP